MLEYPTRGVTWQEYDHQVAATVTSAVGGFVGELRSALSLTGRTARPERPGLSGTVLVRTHFGEARSGQATLSFGGSGLRHEERGWRWETRLDLYRTLAQGHHQLHLAQELDVQGERLRAVGDQFGRFHYLSLDDLATGRPASYTRDLGGTDFRLHRARVAVSAHDAIRVSDRVGLEVGLRLDYQAHMPRPGGLLAVRDRLPEAGMGGMTRWSLSPRIGFAWQYGGHPGVGTFVRIPGSNEFRLMAGVRAPGERLVAATAGMGRVLSGSLGMYRGRLSDQWFRDWASSGQAAGPSRLTCLGDEVPMAGRLTPYDDLPSACGVHTDGSPPDRPVHLPAQGFAAPVGWKGSLTTSAAYRG